MSAFHTAVEKVLQHEGGFVDDPVDPGGATNYGISIRWLRKVGDEDGDGWLDGDLDHDGDIDVDDIRGMSRDQAIDFYRTHFWEAYHYDQIKNQVIAEKVFDFTVNMGSRQSHKILQRACRACRHVIKDDGVIGKMTLSAVNNIPHPTLITAIRSEAAGFYRLLVCKNKKLSKYINGWLNRAYA